MDDANMRHDFDDTIVLSVCYLPRVYVVSYVFFIILRVVMWNLGHVTDYKTITKQEKQKRGVLFGCQLSVSIAIIIRRIIKRNTQRIYEFLDTLYIV